MKKIKILAAVVAVLFIVVSSAFTNKKAPFVTLDDYGWQSATENGLTASAKVTHVWEPSMSAYVTVYQNVVKLQDLELGYDCINGSTGTRCTIDLPIITTSEPANVKFENESDFQVTVKIKEGLGSSYSNDTPDNEVLEVIFE